MTSIAEERFLERSCRKKSRDVICKVNSIFLHTYAHHMFFL